MNSLWLSFGQAAAVAGTTNNSLNGSTTGGFLNSPQRAAAPKEFTESLWFMSTSRTGGRLLGYSSSASGNSSSYDRGVELLANGQVMFGAFPGTQVRVTSTKSYNDGKWHMVAASMSPSDGMKLYVDGQLVGSNSNGVGQDYSGYWRVGGDNV